MKWPVSIVNYFVYFLTTGNRISFYISSSLKKLNCFAKVLVG